MGRIDRYLPEFVRLARLSCTFAALGLAGACLAQEPAPKSPGRISEGNQQITDWNTLASTLEQRLARLLPCDPRVQSSIEEVARASDARIAALVAERQAWSAKSQQQIDALTKYLADHEALAEKWKSADSFTQQESADIRNQLAVLTDLAIETPPLIPAAKSLEGISKTAQEASESGTRNLEEITSLSMSIKDWIVASRTRQEKLELGLKALTDEGQNWRAYYTARSARAKAECSVMNPGTDSETTPAKRTRRSTKSKKAK